MTTLPKWTPERTAQLNALVAGESPVSRQTIETAAAELGTSTRSVAQKLRKEGHTVETASAAAPAFSPEATAALSAFVQNNSGVYTYAEIAANFPGDYDRKVIQGKILAMELTGHVKATEKVVAPKTYTDAEEATVIELANAGKFLEEIADATGKKVNSVRAKALSLLNAGKIAALPKQRDHKAPAEDAYAALGDKIAEMTVEQIAEATGATPRGVKTVLTRRKLVAADYDGAAKAAKTAGK